MSKTVFVPPTSKSVAIPQNAVKVPDPIENQTKKKSNPFMMLLPVVGMVAMVGMMGLMAFQQKQATGQFNPMMMMYPLMMLPMMLPMLMQNMGGGIDIGELNAERVKFAIEQREARDLIHSQGQKVHEQQARQFPVPDALINYVGSKNADYPIMWRVNASQRGGIFVPMADASEDGADRKNITYEAYLAPRVGVGTIRRIPPLDIPDQQTVPDMLEVATTAMWRRFIIINSFMPSMPVALNLGGSPFYGFRGDGETIVSAARAMICSLAFNHSPADLKIAIISPDIDKAHWDWMKWLPHLEDTSRRDRHGNARRAYRSMEEFFLAHREDISKRQQFMAETENTNRWIVFVDDPDHDVSRPLGLSEHGVDGVSFVVLRAGEDRVAIDTRNTFHVTADRDLVSGTGVQQAKVDQMSVLDALLFAKRMNQYTATATGTLESMMDLAAMADEMDAPAGEIPSFFDVLGIKNIEDWDPTQRWERIKFDNHLKFPIGYVREDIKRAIPTPNLAFLDLIEINQGGFPHGAGQGGTGSGKSFLLTSWIATLLTLYGPDRLNMILADWKGGAAFAPFYGMPHVSEIVTNMEGDSEFIERLGTVLLGEVNRRMELFREANDVKDIYEYRAFMRTDPESYPPIPDLIVFIDEFGAFAEAMKQYPEVMAALALIGAQGRSLGVHLIVFSQELSGHMVGPEIWRHMQFFVSLQAVSEQSSTAMLKSPVAAQIEPAAAVIRKGPDKLERFMAFPIEAEYTEQTTEIEEAVDDEIVSIPASGDLVPFTLENKGLILDEDASTDSSISSLAAMLEDAPQQESQKSNIPREKQMLYVLLEKLRKYNDVQAYKLWLPTLQVPVTMHPDSMTISPITSIDNPTFRLGDIDDAYAHARPAFSVRMEGTHNHLAFVGQSRSGLTHSLAALIGSASVSHAPELASFYIIDPAGAGLSYVSEFVNVGSYASQADVDLSDRLIGEALRLLEYREHAMAIGRFEDFPAYFESKKINAPADDHYGRYYLVIDRIDELFNRKPAVIGQIMRLLESGGPRGIHVVASAVKMSWKWEGLFGQIHLHGSEPDTGPMEWKQAIRALPANQPGRTVVHSDARKKYLPARILIPTLEHIEPIGEDRETKKPIWPANYSATIREFGEQIRIFKQKMGVQPARPVQVVQDVIEYRDFWPVFESLPGAEESRDLPLGVNKGDLKFMAFPFREQRHLAIAGAAKSGRTNMLRVFINSLVQQYDPSEVQIFIAESSFQLKEEADVLRDRGYLMEGRGYAYDPASAQAMVEAINTYAQDRQPDIANLDARAVLMGTHWQGPRIFVLIDDYARFSTGSSYALPTAFDEVVKSLSNLDTGIHFITTLNDVELNTFQSTPGTLGEMMKRSQAPILGLSGSRENVLRPRLGDEEPVHFSPRRPGEAMLYTPSDVTRLPVIQTPRVPSWIE